MPLGDPMGGEYQYGKEGLLTGIHAFRVPVSDIGMAVDFYNGVLQMEMAADMGERGSALLSLGDSFLLLYVPRAQEGRQPGGPTGLVLSTDSIYDFHRRMVDEGVEFIRKPLNVDGELTASFIDDDGNEFTVVDRPAGNTRAGPGPSG